MKRRDTILLIIGLPILAACWLAVTFLSADALDQRLRVLAGRGAINCGTIGNGVVGDLSLVQSRAVAAFRNNQPFYYRVATTPLLNAPNGSIGTVMTPQKKMFILIATDPTWSNPTGTVTSELQCYNPRLAFSPNGSVTITFDRVPTKSDSKTKSQSATPGSATPDSATPKLPPKPSNNSQDTSSTR